MNTLRLILGDQLNYKHSWYQQRHNNVYYLVMEMKQETGYVVHHAQKLIGFFAAMYNFAAYLRKHGHNVIHIRINDAHNTQDLERNINNIIAERNIKLFEYQLPDEYRLDEQLKNICSRLAISNKVYDSEHFYTTRTELATLFSGKKTYLMETFYRHMRKKHSVLMDGAEPTGGKWNYDTDNRNLYKGEIPIPAPMLLQHDYSDIWIEIEKAGIEYIGQPSADNFNWPTTRKESLSVLEHFVQHLLPGFGRYQDAMYTGHRYLFHSRLSFAMNVKMISPAEVIESAITQWQRHPDRITLADTEGFVRQILGWREYMRGIYWAQMPAFATLNYLGHDKPLPSWYWTGNTKMNCLKHAVNQSLESAYAHHIQRLMVTGNFALLAGIHPDDVDKWYLGIYIDAIEWVEITNTRGMSQFADGGLIGSKPYISGATYIDKMSNYCKSCHYNKAQKTGTGACPFNSLYWHFYERHRELLSKNIRISMMYGTLNKMKPADKAALMDQAQYYLDNIERL